MVICAQVTTADGGWLLFQLRLHIFTPRLFSLSDSFFLFFFFYLLDLSTKCGSCGGVAALHVSDHPRLPPPPPACRTSSAGCSADTPLAAPCVSERYEVDGCQRPACSGNDAVSLAGSPAWLPSNSTVSTCHRR